MCISFLQGPINKTILSFKSGWGVREDQQRTFWNWTLKYGYSCGVHRYIHTYIQMQRLKWHCHRTVAGALYKIIVSNSCSAVFRRRMHETVSSSVPGGTAATMERPWQATAGHSRHVPLPPGRRVTKCGASRWRHDQCRRGSRPESLTCTYYVSRLLKGLSEV